MSTFTEKDLERAYRVNLNSPAGLEYKQIAQAFAELREECAKVCEARAVELEKSSWSGAVARHCAQLIRELGK